MRGKIAYLALLIAVTGLPALLGCGHSDPTENAAPPPSANAPAPINASQTKRFAGVRGVQGGGAGAPANSGMSKPMAKPPGM